MSTQVVTEKWAGQFDCVECRRKRLIATEFSKKALERYRKNGGALKCTNCVAKVETQEREAAAAWRKEQPLATTTEGATEQRRVCASCQIDFGVSLYNRNQLSKGEGKSRCRSCVEIAVQVEAAHHQQSKTDALEQARMNLEKAQLTPSDTLGVVKAAAKLSALEAEQVTGLKPKIIRRPMRGGRSSSSGRSSSDRGRGRGSGNSK